MTLDTIHAMFKLISAALGTETEINERDRELLKSNIHYVYAFSKHNDMAHLVGAALEKHGLIAEWDECFFDFQKAQYTAIFRQENQDHELERICDVFEKHGIDFIPLKGAIIRGLYPEPWMRTSCDIDIFVKKEHFADAKACMLEVLGYRQGKESLHDESFDAPGGTHVELHFDLLEEHETASAGKVISEVWDRSLPVAGKSHMYCMSDEMFYFYHIAHIAKHIELSGIGMRPFLDLYLLTLDESNRQKRVELLKAGGLDIFESVARELAVYWMCGGELSELGRRTEMFILNCGTYGSQRNSVLLSREKQGGKKKYLINRIFMPYEQIKYSFPVLKKHKWLLPFCQIARWFKLLSPKMARRAASELHSNNTLTDKDFCEINDLFGDIGIKKTV